MTGLPSHPPPVRVIGRTTLKAGDISGMIGVKLVNVPDGPVSALLLIEGGDVRVDLAAGLVFSDDRDGILIPEGAAFLAPVAANLRVVAVERGASVEVVYLAPANAAGAPWAGT